MSLKTRSSLSFAVVAAVAQTLAEAPAADTDTAVLQVASTMKAMMRMLAAFCTTITCFLMTMMTKRSRL